MAKPGLSLLLILSLTAKRLLPVTCLFVLDWHPGHICSVSCIKLSQSEQNFSRQFGHSNTLVPIFIVDGRVCTLMLVVGRFSLLVEADPFVASSVCCICPLVLELVLLDIIWVSFPGGVSESNGCMQAKHLALTVREIGESLTFLDLLHVRKSQ